MWSTVLFLTTDIRNPYLVHRQLGSWTMNPVMYLCTIFILAPKEDFLSTTYDSFGEITSIVSMTYEKLCTKDYCRAAESS